MSKLYHTKRKRYKSASSCKSIELVHNTQDDSTFEDLPLDDVPLIVSAKKGEQLLITLNAPDTWNNGKENNAGTWFAIEVNDQIIGKGVYFTGQKGQRVPISIQAVYEVTEDANLKVKGKWAVCNNGKSFIGAFSETTLTVLKV
ncbi:hypothetical protein PPO43_15775 [Saprospira sp. CCB-QB6]|uniref:hypothetical protein n=1 Tax=Saprospira sp. CCB-QB6 TaxID=3023936 RepID=UPI00234A31DA|nr:hypothetical protein [Saprospira sp. CCB-QB6]WCL81433.1 hypothetical protein PPO43_15775 [Saprospira sp. CCB-QB6]